MGFHACEQPQNPAIYQVLPYELWDSQRTKWLYITKFQNFKIQKRLKYNDSMGAVADKFQTMG